MRAPGGLIELIAGDAAAAERELGSGYEALRQAGERATRASIAALLAGAVYAQGCPAEAQHLAGHQREASCAHGQFEAARDLASQALAMIPAPSRVALLAEMLVTKAEVLRLAGAPREARGCLRQALAIYTERHAAALAEQTRSALADLGA